MTEESEPYVISTSMEFVLRGEGGCTRLLAVLALLGSVAAVAPATAAEVVVRLALGFGGFRTTVSGLALGNDWPGTQTLWCS